MTPCQSFRCATADALLDDTVAIDESVSFWALDRFAEQEPLNFEGSGNLDRWLDLNA